MSRETKKEKEARLKLEESDYVAAVEARRILAQQIFDRLTKEEQIVLLEHINHLRPLR